MEKCSKGVTKLTLKNEIVTEAEKQLIKSYSYFLRRIDNEKDEMVGNK